MVVVANLITFFPILLVLHCLCIFLFKRWLGPVGTFYGSIFIFCLCLICAFNDLYFILLNGNYFFVDFGRWFFCLDLIDSHLVFCIDSLALISAMLVLVLTALALYFGVEYMYRDAFINRLLYLLNMFATSVVFLFFCYDFFLIVLCWECIGLFSFLLVNFYSMRIYTIKAALKTFIFGRISDMFMFLAFLLTIIVFNTTDLSLIFLQIPFFLFHYVFIGSISIHFLTLFAFSIALSGVIKAAQFFFHVWLPDAMEAPTPASALIHSSTLVIAGIFLIIRFSILFEFSLLVDYFLALLGAVTLAFGAITAIFQTDIKKLVAFSTISQIGYLVCGCGFCCYEEVLLYLIIHALNKAFLFILVGYIVHYFNGNTDMRQMGGIYLYSFDIAVFLFGVCFNLAGLPYSAGFFVKEFLVFQLLRDGFLAFFVRACWLVSFFFTPIYMFILVFIVLYGPKKGVLTTYQLGWHALTTTHIQTLLRYYYTQVVSYQYYNNSLGRIWWPRLQFTLVTARPTSILLFSFWCFFYFFGEILLLLLFNFITIQDLIGSHFFFFIKTHVIFLLNTTSVFLNNIIYFYIMFFSLCGILFLLNFKYTFFYNYIDYSWYYEFIFIICTIVFICLFI